MTRPADPASLPAAAPERTIPGWHGKLPSLGDFASRRLAPAFLDPWDRWLGQSLLALQTARPADWLADYLHCPSWRFLLCPGVLPGSAGDEAWAGVLLPSVDRVGRYFPLTLVRPLGAAVPDSGAMQALWDWLARLEELALDALDEDWSPERLEAELARMATPPWPHGRTGPSSATPATPPGLAPGNAPSPAWFPGSALDHMSDQALALWWPDQAHGRSYWTSAPAGGEAHSLSHRGLPAPGPIQGLFVPQAALAQAGAHSTPPGELHRPTHTGPAS
jgi:type VI secretion system protein ImpM